MAKFHIGQRVRVVSIENDREHRLIGREGVIVNIAPMGWMDWMVVLDGHGGACAFCSRNLAPLTDPKADAFIAGIKKFAQEPVGPLKEREVA